MTQLHLHCCHDNLASATCWLKHCIHDVGNWMSANHLRLNMEKTELLCARSHYGFTVQSSTPLGSSAPFLRLRANIVNASDHVRVLGTMISSDLTLDKHVSSGCASCFHWLCQLRQVRRSLDTCDCLGPRSRDISHGLL